ncbi:MAG TPA: hypothetical protein PLZ84_07760, partial [Clostridia bacterium]|nr:hypothetical protein [Clostridia bacterium]
MAVEQSVVEYKGFGKCARLANGTVELLATLDMGPRIIRFGFIGGKNEFCEALDKGSDTPNGFWPMIGGHRLWHSPEDMPLTYTIDDRPVDYQWLENGLKVTSQVDIHSGLQKELIITMDAQGTSVKVTHNLYNKNPWPVEYSAWALSVMATGGVSIIPQNTEDTDLLPNRYMTIWPYTKFSDPRLVLGDKYILFRQDPNATTKCKIGLANHCGWTAYINDKVMFIKKFKHIDGAVYP